MLRLGFFGLFLYSTHVFGITAELSTPPHPCSFREFLESPLQPLSYLKYSRILQIHSGEDAAFASGILVLSEKGEEVLAILDSMPGRHSILQLALQEQNVRIKKILWMGEIQSSRQGIVAASEISGDYAKTQRDPSRYPYPVENSVKRLEQYLTHFSSDLIAKNAQFLSYKERSAHLDPRVDKISKKTQSDIHSLNNLYNPTSIYVQIARKGARTHGQATLSEVPDIDSLMSIFNYARQISGARDPQVSADYFFMQKLVDKGLPIVLNFDQANELHNALNRLYTVAIDHRAAMKNVELYGDGD